MLSVCGVFKSIPHIGRMVLIIFEFVIIDFEEEYFKFFIIFKYALLLLYSVYNLYTILVLI